MALERLKEIDRTLYSVLQGVSIALVNPNNEGEEQKRFFKSKDHEPKFTYDPPPFDVQRRKKKLRSLRFGDTPLDGIFRKKAVEIHHLLSLIEGIGSPGFTAYSEKIWGRPNEALLRKAKQFISVHDSRLCQSPSNIPSREALRHFRSVLSELGFEWRVEEQEMVAKAMVIPQERLFVVKKGFRFSKSQLKSFTLHEVFGHILRAECGMLQPYLIFQAGLDGYEETEEGLALHKERMGGTLTERTLKGYAGRVTAIDVALRNGFRDTYEHLRNVFSRENAWTLTVRVKRGLTDTSQPGCLTKDLSYLKGYLAIESYLSKGGTLKDLHYGKVGLHHVPILSSIPSLRDPDVFIANHFKGKHYFGLFW